MKLPLFEMMTLHVKAIGADAIPVTDVFFANLCKSAK
jgi:hypothetical protein